MYIVFEGAGGSGGALLEVRHGARALRRPIWPTCAINNDYDNHDNTNNNNNNNNNTDNDIHVCVYIYIYIYIYS